MRPSSVLGLIAALALPASAMAGGAYVDSTRFAVSGYDVVAYFDLPVASGAAAVRGSRANVAIWKGATYAFATAANRDRFLANPQRYLPQFDGHCAWAAGQGYKAPASPTVWRVVDGKLYLNYSQTIRQRWDIGTTAQIAKGETNWRSLDPQPPATGDAEDYDPKAAPLP